MTAATIPPLRSDWHRMGAGLSVRFELVNGTFSAEWSPRMPTKREFKRMVDRYRQARNLFIAQIAARGTSVAVVELPE
ncbi:hypothetical protein [Azohydromonas sp.]|uniref:hypothetical protein n=1 Tax=Azohydromonas sp. TaxID=1872666 RepID=UPI002BA911C9|nr:hypothetical protein [Azohydromonas sp.]HMM83913.1 hypothetical protein [Azohydromonas sp.]